MDRKLICSALGLKEEATDAEITAAITSRNEAEAKAKAEVEALKTEAAKVTGAAGVEVKMLTERLEASTKANEALTARVTGIEAAAAEKDRKALARKLIGEGRFTASQAAEIEEYAKDKGLEKAAAFFSKFPVVIPKGEVGLDGGDEGIESSAHAQAKVDALTADLEKTGLTGTRAMRAAARKAPALFALASNPITVPPSKN